MVQERDQSLAFLFFLAQATLRGTVTHDESEELQQIYQEIVVDGAGFELTQFNSSDPVFRAVDRHAVGLMKQRLLELHPELETDLDRFLGNGPGRA